ncbi:MAG TPA: hypothetical protein VFW00_11915 [Rhodocyclaceae bacterium]|nr:hypothetical protein [Rhodocyclaceae bacterium]
MANKVIVFSGHGAWALGNDTFVRMPANCSIKFYTMNMKTLSDNLGGDIDRGIITGLEPDQEAGPHVQAPDMRLYPPHGLNIRQPDMSKWHVIKLPAAIPVDDKNIQIQIDNKCGGGGSLAVMLKLLQNVIANTESITFLWAACRAVNLKAVGGKAAGVNIMQRSSGGSDEDMELQA